MVKYIFVAAITLTGTILFTLGENISSYHDSCEFRFKIANIYQCCVKPLFLPPIVTEMCASKPTHAVPTGQVQPITSNCQAECALNMTRILSEKKFSLQRAMQVLTSRMPPDSEWRLITIKAITVCHNVLNVHGYFFDKQIEAGEISSECLPLSSGFLDCVLAITYRRCPDASWVGGEGCDNLIHLLNNCPYIFVESSVF